MSKRNYTHIKLIEAEIIAMREAGKSRREIAEHFGLEKEQIKWWINRYNRKQKKLKVVRAKMCNQEIWLQSRRMRSIVLKWKTSYCGIFCN